MPHATQMSAPDTGLLVIDVQEKLVPRILDTASLVRDIAFLIDVARILNMPVQCTEQYPRGLGATVPELAEKLPLRPDKVAFSSCAVPEVVQTFHLEARPKIVLCGIETHVCVSQTVHDLVERGVEVHVPADAVGSRHELDYQRGLERMERAGAVVTTVEAALFELLERAGTPEFKAVQRLIL